MVMAPLGFMGAESRDDERRCRTRDHADAGFSERGAELAGKAQKCGVAQLLRLGRGVEECYERVGGLLHGYSVLEIENDGSPSGL